MLTLKSYACVSKPRQTAVPSIFVNWVCSKFRVKLVTKMWFGLSKGLAWLQSNVTKQLRGFIWKVCYIYIITYLISSLHMLIGSWTMEENVQLCDLFIRRLTERAFPWTWQPRVFICMFICLFFFMSDCLYFGLFNCWSVIFYVCLSIARFVCIPARLCVGLFASLSVSLNLFACFFSVFVSLSVLVFNFFSPYLSVCLPTYSQDRLLTDLFVRLFVYLYVFVSVCLFLSVCQ